MRSLLLPCALTMACTGAPTPKPPPPSPPAAAPPAQTPAIDEIDALDLTLADQRYTYIFTAPNGWQEVTMLAGDGRVRFGRGFDITALRWWSAPSLDTAAITQVADALTDPIFETLPKFLGIPTDQVTPTTEARAWTIRPDPFGDVRTVTVFGDKGPLVAQLACIEQIARQRVTLPRLGSVWRVPATKVEAWLPCEAHQIANIRPALQAMEAADAATTSASDPTTPLLLAVDRVDGGGSPSLRLFADDHVQRIARDGAVTWVRLSNAQRATVDRVMASVAGRSLPDLCPRATHTTP